MTDYPQFRLRPHHAEELAEVLRKDRRQLWPQWLEDLVHWLEGLPRDDGITMTAWPWKDGTPMTDRQEAG
jgi:hypothetical protein